MAGCPSPHDPCARMPADHFGPGHIDKWHCGQADARVIGKAGETVFGFAGTVCPPRAVFRLPEDRHRALYSMSGSRCPVRPAASFNTIIARTRKGFVRHGSGLIRNLTSGGDGQPVLCGRICVTDRIITASCLPTGSAGKTTEQSGATAAIPSTGLNQLKLPRHDAPAQAQMPGR